MTLTKVSAAARLAHAQREHANGDHLQLVADLRGDAQQAVKSSQRNHLPCIGSGRPHRIAEGLGGSGVSHLRALPGAPAQSEAVQARLQLLRLFTQEPLNTRRPGHARSQALFMRRRFSLTDATRPRCELFTKFTLTDEKTPPSTKSLRSGDRGVKSVCTVAF